MDEPPASRQEAVVNDLGLDLFMESQDRWLQKDKLLVTKQCRKRRTFYWRRGIGCTGNDSLAHGSLREEFKVPGAGQEVQLESKANWVPEGFRSQAKSGDVILDSTEEACLVGRDKLEVSVMEGR